MAAAAASRLAGVLTGLEHGEAAAALLLGERPAAENPAAERLTLELLRRQGQARADGAERARLAERRELAGVLHDESLQRMLAATQDVQEAIDGADRTASLEEAKENLRLATAHLRAAVGAGYRGELDGTPFLVRVRQLLDRHATRGRLRTVLAADPNAAGIADALVLACLGELLANVVRHAGASQVTVSVDALPGAVRLRVEDDGAGASPEGIAEQQASGHIGLLLAQERVRRAAGSWALDTAPGAGFRVTVTIPLRLSREG